MLYLTVTQIGCPVSVFPCAQYCTPAWADYIAVLAVVLLRVPGIAWSHLHATDVDHHERD